MLRDWGQRGMASFAIIFKVHQKRTLKILIEKLKYAVIFLVEN